MSVSVADRDARPQQAAPTAFADSRARATRCRICPLPMQCSHTPASLPGAGASAASPGRLLRNEGDPTCADGRALLLDA